MTDTWGPIKNN